MKQDKTEEYRNNITLHLTRISGDIEHIKEKVNDVMVLEEKIEKMVEDELEETGAYGTGLGLNYSEKRPAYNFKSQGPFQGRMTGPGYNFESGGPLREIKERIVKKINNIYIHLYKYYT